MADDRNNQRSRRGAQHSSQETASQGTNIFFSIDYGVRGIAQPKSVASRTTNAITDLSWKNQQSNSIESTIDLAGIDFQRDFDNNTRLSGAPDNWLGLVDFVGVNPLQPQSRPDKVFIDEAKTTLIAGCKFDELSWETGGHGLLTKAFLNIVNASNFQITYSELLDQLRATVTSDFSSLIAPSITSDLPQSQTPQLRGERNRMNQGFLQGFIDSR